MLNAEPKSRLEDLRDRGILPQYPDNPAPWLTARLMEIGPAESTGMGPAPISWSTLGEWQKQSGVRLTPWQARILRRLSHDWIAESQRAAKKGASAPCGEMTIEQRRKIVSDQVDAMFGGMAAAEKTAPPSRGMRRR